MRPLPVADPGTPDFRSATTYLLWVARRQLPTMLMAMVFGIVWMVSQALMPAVIGRAIDDGLTARSLSTLGAWTAALFGLGAVQAFAGIMRHRLAVFNWLGGAYRTVQVVSRHAAMLGATLPKRLAAGEVVSIGTADTNHIGGAMDIVARGSGAVVSIIVVAVLLLGASVPLGLVVVLGVPLVMMLAGLLLRPLHRRQQAYRDQQGTLTTRASDIVAGLRVLRGIGGESVFGDRYRDESQALRHAGVRVARVESVLEAGQVLLPGAFVVLVTWLGARFAAAGAITPGQLVAFYGYAVFLIAPLRTITEALDRMTRGHVAARRVIRVLSLEPELTDPATPARVPAAGGELTDPVSGIVIRPGRVTAIASAVPEETATIADRLGRYVESEAALAGVPLRDLDRAAVRDLILVAENDARLFSGPLRTELDPRGGASDAELMAALDAANAIDILDALPDGLGTEVADRGREFSGGQQQRLRLARALLADPPILVLVEPTSAVDAHTEARIAARLGAARAGRTTVVCTSSPLVLDRADHVVYVEGGRMVAEGTHRELLRAEPRYAATVVREEDP
jgi:ABC-type multidrug transport system fused ATPase/permease subunit